jgi:hypothetical protein
MSDNTGFNYLMSSSTSLGAALTALAALGTSFGLLATTTNAFEKTFVTHPLGFMVNCPLTTHVAYQLISFLLRGFFKSTRSSCGCLRLLSYRSFWLSHYDMPRENIIIVNHLDAELKEPAIYSLSSIIAMAE